MIRARDLLLHPLALAAIAVLAANDRWWKLDHPGWLTGKLSDVAGLAFFPLLVLVVVERLVASRRRALAISVTATAVVFALVKTLPAAAAAFGSALGLLQWPGAAALALVHGHAIPGPVAAGIVVDPTDLLALPFVAVSAIIALRRGYALAASSDRPELEPDHDGSRRRLVRGRDQVVDV